MTYPETMFNLISFYTEGPTGEWVPITPGLIRNMLLDPKIVPAFMTNMHMEYAEVPLRFVPAHIPSLADIALISPLALDLVPVLPKDRKALSITDEWLVLQSVAGTNNVKWMHIVSEANQMRLEAAWGIQKGGTLQMFGAKVKTNSLSMYSHYLERYVVLDNNASQETKIEMLRISDMKPGMSILLWNARGISRDGFKRNIRHLIKDHHPKIVILTETKVSKSSCEDIIDTFPFNSFEVVDPVGLSGGILIMWNSGVISVTTVSKQPRAIHVVVQVRMKCTGLLGPDNPIIPLNTTTPLDPFDCSAPPSLSELKEALFSIGSLKASGVDGFHALFYQTHWDLIHLDLLSFITAIFRDKTIPYHQ
uniref:Uncharacterized protein n=1 Tax=Chenopodium quinoa TaxID=63459 RepID=A0A803LZN6_CHEQI